MNFVITGAGKGIGFELVKKCLSDPQNQIIACSRTTDQLSHLKSTSEDYDKRLHVVACNLTNENDMASFVKAVGSQFPRLDILINNAGILGKGPFNDYNEELAREVFEVNFFAPATLTRRLMPLLREATNAHVVNIGSMGGFQGSSKFPGLAYYSASKSALACLSECLASEFNGSAVSFNCLALGSVQTEMLNEAFPGYKALQKPEDMAEFIYDFACKSGRFLNGKIIPVSFPAT